MQVGVVIREEIRESEGEEPEEGVTCQEGRGLWGDYGRNHITAQSNHGKKRLPVSERAMLVLVKTPVWLKSRTRGGYRHSLACTLIRALENVSDSFHLEERSDT